MLQLKKENKQKSITQKKEVGIRKLSPDTIFLMEVRSELGIDFSKCDSFEEFKNIFIKKCDNETLKEALHLSNSSLKNDNQIELSSRKRCFR